MSKEKPWKKSATVLKGGEWVSSCTLREILERLPGRLSIALSFLEAFCIRLESTNEVVEPDFLALTLAKSALENLKEDCARVSSISYISDEAAMEDLEDLHDDLDSTRTILVGVQSEILDAIREGRCSVDRLFQEAECLERVNGVACELRDFLDSH